MCGPDALHSCVDGEPPQSETATDLIWLSTWPHDARSLPSLNAGYHTIGAALLSKITWRKCAKDRDSLRFLHSSCGPSKLTGVRLRGFRLNLALITYLAGGAG